MANFGSRWLALLDEYNRAVRAYCEAVHAFAKRTHPPGDIPAEMEALDAAQQRCEALRPRLIDSFSDTTPNEG